MGAPSGGGGYGGGGYPSTGNAGMGGGYGPSGTNQLVGYSGQPYGGGAPQQPAYGMGTGGQYSPQLRQAQTAWQNQYTPAAETQGGSLADMPLQRQPIQSDAERAAATAAGQAARAAAPGPWWMQGSQQPMGGMQPYGMGAQGNGNAYGYGGQQGNPWADPWRGISNSDPRVQMATQPMYNSGQQGNPFASMLAMLQQPQQQGSTSLAPQASQPQAPLQAPRPVAPPPPAAPTRANYSPNNPFAGMYTTPQGDAWEQQQRGGVPAATPVPAAPAPAAPGTDVMRKALAAGVPNQGTNPGYGYGTPGGYQLDTAPSTLDPGSMTGLLSILGGNVNGRNWQGQAADYATWYQNTYGKQAPNAPTAYWTT